MKKTIFLIFALALCAHAQKRVLVSPGGDARYLTGQQSAGTLVRGDIASRTSSLVCTDKFTFGYSTDAYPGANVGFEAFHQDVMAMWYVAPASGSIDTVFVYNLDVGTLDSTVTVRLFNSNIYPGSGPGYGGYPKPGKLCWGYYLSTNDLDNGLAAFPEDATDTTWYSTVPGVTPSFSPMANEIWGFGGFPKVMNANATNAIAMADLATVEVTAGQPFFITIRMYGPHREQVDDLRTGYLATEEPDSLQTHNWKFYEHIYEGPGFTCPGWVARGEFNFLIWYSMTVTTNIPPSFSNITRIDNTFDTGPQPVQVDILDCDAENPLSAGVEDAVIRYSRNGEIQPDIPLFYLGGDTWEATLPGGDVNDRISYRIVASDSSGASDSSAAIAYRIVSLVTPWYTADTGAVCADDDIRSTGTTVDNASFFVPSFPGSGTLPMDDGTSGPYDMGSNFTVFGDTFRYAWIGVNGGIALGKSATDTLDVNANGFGTRQWDFPNPQKGGREDTSGADDMPGMFIAPFWADMIVGDTSGAYGRIVYGNNGDSCLFIVEWDSVGSFGPVGPLADPTTFRVVLNRCTGGIDFQYVNVGTLGLDSAALVGMQADSNGVSGTEPGWIYVNRGTYPYETKPRNNWCVRLYPNIGTTALDGWNMVSVPMTPVDGDYSRTSLFPSTTSPGAVSAAFEYGAGYAASDSLIPGKGYWVKFSGDGRTGSSPGTLLECVSVPVQDKWNIIGGPSGFVTTAGITPTGTSIVSPFYGYGTTGYYAATVLEPGNAYWVKVEGAGSLTMCSSGGVPKSDGGMNGRINLAELNRITVTDAAGRSQSLYLDGEERTGSDPGMFELPPPPPAGAFDVRFTSQRMVEAYPPEQSVEGDALFPLSIRGASRPVSIGWDLPNAVSGGRSMAIEYTSGETAVRRTIEGSGSVVIRDGEIGSIVLRIAAGGGIPGAFSLGQNYPNPFNPATALTYSLPADNRVSIRVYDLIGREVRTLVDGERPAGTFTAVWDGMDRNGFAVPTGMYIVRMTAGTFSAARKVVLMK